MLQLFNVWNGLNFSRKIIVIAATVGMFFTIIAMTRMVTAPTMGLLYAGLEPSAAGEVIQALEARGVAFDVRGNSIYVDSKQRDSLRMTLASEGQPAIGAGGYELLDNLSGFGTTSQMFDAAYWRAKEGELARTIVASPHISSARVHIANGGSAPFRRGVTPTASVAITPVGGVISPAQAKSLKFLVASAVAGLAPEDVAVIDSDGALLGSGAEPTQDTLGEDRAEKLKQKVERLLEARVGFGNAIVEVSVETVNEREAIRERILDPENRVAISTDTEESSNASSQTGGGQVTVASNLPDEETAQGDGANSQNNLSRERVNYEISETEREVLRAPGAVKRLSVAVLVNDVETQNAAGQIEFGPRDPEELQALRELVGSAVGFDEARGDVITIKSMILRTIQPAGVAAQPSLLGSFAIDWMSAIQMAVLAVVTIILGLFVIRPILSGNATVAPQAEPAALPGASGNRDEIGDNDGSDDATLPDLGNDIGMDDDMMLPDLPMMGGFAGEAGTPADRLRGLIDERQTETMEILKTWLDDKEEAA